MLKELREGAHDHILLNMCMRFSRIKKNDNKN